MSAKIYIGKDNNDGRTFHAMVSDTINVYLNYNIATGYMWKVLESDSDVLILEDISRTVNTSFNKVGVPDEIQYSFSVVNPGERDVFFVLKRPWEDDADAQETFTITVKAHHTT